MTSHAEWPLDEFAVFIELIGDAVVASAEDGRILFVNNAAVEQFGHPREDLLNMTVFDVTPADRREALAEERRAFFAGIESAEHGRHERHSVLRADGSVYPVEMSYSHFSTPSGPVRVSLLRDISERLSSAAEREDLRSRLEQSQIRRMEAVGQLAGGIAHDFNNLLGVIINYADFAIEELADRPAVRKDVEEILAAANRAANLTQQLLIFSRRKTEPRRPVDINEVIREIEPLMRRALGERIEMVTAFEPELASVVADAGELEQAVINLAINGRDAMPDGGVLEIETSNVQLDAAYLASRPDPVEPGAYVRLTVSDTGVGMTPEVLEHAFEPFFTTKKSDGTGLGLATVYGSVKSHGGDVFIYSEPGRGTSVKIHLPASGDAAVPFVKTPRLSAVRGHGERVLVVEDEESVRRMVVRALSTNGYEAVDCEEAGAALELLGDANEEFALLLTDVILPGIDGGELAKLADERRPGMPVLFMSGYSELAMRHTDGDGEEIDILEKPFTVSALLREVHRLIEEVGP